MSTRFRPATSRANGPQLSSALAAAHRGLRCRLASACLRLDQRVTALVKVPQGVFLSRKGLRPSPPARIDDNSSTTRAVTECPG